MLFSKNVISDPILNMIVVIEFIFFTIFSLLVVGSNSDFTRLRLTAAIELPISKDCKLLGKGFTVCYAFKFTQWPYVKIPTGEKLAQVWNHWNLCL